MLSIILLTILFVIASILLTVRYAFWKNAENTTKSYLKKFKYVPDLDIYEESQQLFNYGEKKIKHAVLLIHGYSCSVDELRSLAKELDNNKITYYAPMLTGFGVSSLNKLYNINTSDWLRDSVCAYDLLSGISEEVSIIGHSTGSVLAAYIAEHRKVKHLVLTGPNFFVGKSEAKYKNYLKNKHVRNLVLWLLPAVVKPIRRGRSTFTDTLEPNAAQNVFHHPSITLKSLIATWELQDKVDILKANYETLMVMYGKQDLTVDVKPFLEMLDIHEVKYKKFEFDNCAHNVLEDYQKDEAIRIILEHIKQ
ncbi:MAG: alpha/beta hydrolase [Deltaproteobacteria bacterium]